MNSPVQIAVIGFGRFGQLHAQAFAQAGAEIAAIVEPRVEAREAASSLYPDASVYSEVEQFLSALGSNVDGVIIASSELTHYEIGMACIHAGINCLIEKPLAGSAAQAQELLAAARAREVIVQTGFILRYEPRHLLLHENVASGQLGDLQVMRAKRDVSRGWFHAYGHTVSPILETIVHDIDLALWLFPSRPSFVQAWGTYSLGYETPETVTLLIGFESGGQAFLTSSWLRAAREVPNILSWELDGDREDEGGVIAGDLEILGTQGSAHIASYSDSFAISTDKTTAYPDTSFWPVIGGRVWGALAAEAIDFVNQLSGRPSLGVASLEDAVLGQRIAEAGLRSLDSGSRESL
jgi:predicted dehydrogenase